MLSARSRLKNDRCLVMLSFTPSEHQSMYLAKYLTNAYPAITFPTALPRKAVMWKVVRIMAQHCVPSGVSSAAGLPWRLP